MERRKALTGLAVGLVVATYPVVWALGYQDHPWHWHTAATVVAFAAVVVASALHAIRAMVVPPEPRWLTIAAMVVSYAALLSAVGWGIMGDLSQEVVGGPHVIVMPIFAALGAWAVAAVLTWLVRLRLQRS